MREDCQYRALALGWTDERIVVIDQDLGHSAAATADLLGFQQLVAWVGLGQVGLVLELEVSRLARNSSDWHHLLVGRLSRPWPLWSAGAMTAKHSTAIGTTADQGVSSISCAVAPPFAFASPHEGCRISVPALSRLLQPGNDLLRSTRMLSV